MRRKAVFILPALLLILVGCADQVAGPEPDLVTFYKKPPKPPPDPDPEPAEPANPVIGYESGDALWVMDEDGGNRTKIFEPGSYFIPSWSTQGNGTSSDPYMVLITGLSAGRLPVVIAEVVLDGGVPRVGAVRTLSNDLMYVQARVSPDGQSLVAVHVGPPEEFQGSIVFSDLSSFSPQTAYVASGHEVFQPAWNPDGSRIAFFDLEGATGVITAKLMDVTTFSVSTAFTVPCFPRGLSWSPVSERDELAFDCDGSIATVVLDETLPMDDPPIQFLGTGTAPIWSADGTKIIYTNRNRIYVKTIGSSSKDVRLTGGMRPDWKR